MENIGSGSILHKALQVALNSNEVKTKQNGVSTRDTHVGKSNYSEKKIQPWDIWIEYSLNPFDADIVKRILRTKKEPNMTVDEARLMDYNKILHIVKERIHQLENGNPYYANSSESHKSKI